MTDDKDFEGAHKAPQRSGEPSLVEEGQLSHAAPDEIVRYSNSERPTGMVKATLQCNLSGKPFAVWFGSEDEIPLACEQLKATLITTTPSNETELVLAQFEALFCRAMFPRNESE